MSTVSTILIVDDEPFNVDYLEQELADLSYRTVSAANGQQALERVLSASPDLILLDIMMPVMDGFDVLRRLKANPATSDIPVIIISAMNDMHSIAYGIKLGADDYLPKPFDPVLLQARITAGLDKKMRRDQELEYLRQVELLTAAAQSVERNAYDPATIEAVSARPDALGNLARVFQQMARQVVEREQRLKQQLSQLKMDMEERASAAADSPAAYLPMDRRQALARGKSLPDRTQGAALMADISGFTPLTESFVRALGPQRGAEELTRQLNRVYTALIAVVHHYHGSVIGFSGDAISCWFDDDTGLTAVACALAMQDAMQPFAIILTPDNMSISISVKIAVSAGKARRFVIGDPKEQLLDVLAGHVLDEVSDAEKHATRTQVIVPAALASALGNQLILSEGHAHERYAVVRGLATPVVPAPWSELAHAAIPPEQAQAWVLPAVFEKVKSGKSDLLSELRPVASLFLQFFGLHYEAPDAETKLNVFVQWVQSVVASYEGAVLQLIIGDKGSYFYIAFGAPVAHPDDVLRALQCGLALQTPPEHLSFIHHVQIGIAYGAMRVGAYGSPAHRTYGVIGDKANLAARLMEAAENGILVDEPVYHATRGRLKYESLPPMSFKGKLQPIVVYRPLGENAGSALPAQPGTQNPLALLIDRLAPEHQMALKAAAVIGRVFAFAMLKDIYPDAAGRIDLADSLRMLTGLNLIAREDEQTFRFADALTHETAYGLMLFAQRRQLHRAAAEWYEQNHRDDLTHFYPILAYHWRAANEPAKAMHYFEQAGKSARANGAYEEAMHYFLESLTLGNESADLSVETNKGAPVLSAPHA